MKIGANETYTRINAVTTFLSEHTKIMLLKKKWKKYYLPTQKFSALLPEPNNFFRHYNITCIKMVSKFNSGAKVISLWTSQTMRVIMIPFQEGPSSFPPRWAFSLYFHLQGEHNQLNDHTWSQNNNLQFSLLILIATAITLLHIFTELYILIKTKFGETQLFIRQAFILLQTKINLINKTHLKQTIWVCNNERTHEPAPHFGHRSSACPLRAAGPRPCCLGAVAAGPHSQTALSALTYWGWSNCGYTNGVCACMSHTRIFV